MHSLAARREEFAERTGYFAGGRADHSALMLASRITLPHFSVAAATSLPKSAREVAIRLATWLRAPAAMATEVFDRLPTARNPPKRPLKYLLVRVPPIPGSD